MAADGNPDFVVNSPELVLNSSRTGYLYGPVYEQNDAGLWVKTTTKFDTNFEFSGSIVEIYNASEELLETTDTTVTTTASGSKEVGTYEVEGEVVKSWEYDFSSDGDFSGGTEVVSGRTITFNANWEVTSEKVKVSGDPLTETTQIAAEALAADGDIYLSAEEQLKDSSIRQLYLDNEGTVTGSKVTKTIGSSEYVSYFDADGEPVGELITELNSSTFFQKITNDEDGSYTESGRFQQLDEGDAVTYEREFEFNYASDGAFLGGFEIENGSKKTLNKNYEVVAQQLTDEAKAEKLANLDEVTSDDYPMYFSDGDTGFKETNDLGNGEVEEIYYDQDFKIVGTASTFTTPSGSTRTSYFDADQEFLGDTEETSEGSRSLFRIFNEDGSWTEYGDERSKDGDDVRNWQFNFASDGTFTGGQEEFNGLITNFDENWNATNSLSDAAKAELDENLLSGSDLDFIPDALEFENSSTGEKQAKYLTVEFDWGSETQFYNEDGTEVLGFSNTWSDNWGPETVTGTNFNSANGEYLGDIFNFESGRLEYRFVTQDGEYQVETGAEYENASDETPKRSWEFTFDQQWNLIEGQEVIDGVTTEFGANWEVIGRSISIESLSVLSEDLDESDINFSILSDLPFEISDIPGQFLFLDDNFNDVAYVSLEQTPWGSTELTYFDPETGVELGRSSTETWDNGGVATWFNDSNWNWLGEVSSDDFAVRSIKIEQTDKGYIEFGSELRKDEGIERTWEFEFDNAYNMLGGSQIENGVEIEFGPDWTILSKKVDLTGDSIERVTDAAEISLIPTALHASADGDLVIYLENDFEWGTERTYFSEDGNILGYSNSWENEWDPQGGSGTSFNDANWNYLGDVFTQGNTSYIRAETRNDDGTRTEVGSEVTDGEVTRSWEYNFDANFNLINGYEVQDGIKTLLGKNWKQLSVEIASDAAIETVTDIDTNLVPISLLVETESGYVAYTLTKEYDWGGSEVIYLSSDDSATSTVLGYEHTWGGDEYSTDSGSGFENADREWIGNYHENDWEVSAHFETIVVVDLIEDDGVGAEEVRYQSGYRLEKENDYYEEWNFIFREDGSLHEGVENRNGQETKYGPNWTVLSRVNADFDPTTTNNVITVEEEPLIQFLPEEFTYKLGDENLKDVNGDAIVPSDDNGDAIAAGTLFAYFQEFGDRIQFYDTTGKIIGNANFDGMGINLQDASGVPLGNIYDDQFMQVIRVTTEVANANGTRTESGQEYSYTVEGSSDTSSSSGTGATPYDPAVATGDGTYYDPAMDTGGGSGGVSASDYVIEETPSRSWEYNFDANFNLINGYEVQDGIKTLLGKNWKQLSVEIDSDAVIKTVTDIDANLVPISLLVETDSGYVAYTLTKEYDWGGSEVIYLSSDDSATSTVLGYEHTWGGDEHSTESGSGFENADREWIGNYHENDWEVSAYFETIVVVDLIEDDGVGAEEVRYQSGYRLEKADNSYEEWSFIFREDGSLHEGVENRNGQETKYGPNWTVLSRVNADFDPTTTNNVITVEEEPLIQFLPEKFTYKLGDEDLVDVKGVAIVPSDDNGDAIAADTLFVYFQEVGGDMSAGGPQQIQFFDTTGQIIGYANFDGMGINLQDASWNHLGNVYDDTFNQVIRVETQSLDIVGRNTFTVIEGEEYSYTVEGSSDTSSSSGTGATPYDPAAATGDGTYYDPAMDTGGGSGGVSASDYVIEETPSRSWTHRYDENWNFVGGSETSNGITEVLGRNWVVLSTDVNLGDGVEVETLTDPELVPDVLMVASTSDGVDFEAYRIVLKEGEWGTEFAYLSSSNIDGEPEILGYENTWNDGVQSGGGFDLATDDGREWLGSYHVEADYKNAWFNFDVTKSATEWLELYATLDTNFDPATDALDNLDTSEAEITLRREVNYNYEKVDGEFSLVGGRDMYFYGSGIAFGGTESWNGETTVLGEDWETLSKQAAGFDPFDEKFHLTVAANPYLAFLPDTFFADEDKTFIYGEKEESEASPGEPRYTIFSDAGVVLGYADLDTDYNKSLHMNINDAEYNSLGGFHEQRNKVEVYQNSINADGQRVEVGKIYQDLNEAYGTIELGPLTQEYNYVKDVFGNIVSGTRTSNGITEIIGKNGAVIGKDASPQGEELIENLEAGGIWIPTTLIFDGKISFAESALTDWGAVEVIYFNDAGEIIAYGDYREEIHDDKTVIIHHFNDKNNEYIGHAYITSDRIEFRNEYVDGETLHNSGGELEFDAERNSWNYENVFSTQFDAKTMAHLGGYEIQDGVRTDYSAGWQVTGISNPNFNPAEALLIASNAYDEFGFDLSLVPEEWLTNTGDAYVDVVTFEWSDGFDINFMDETGTTLGKALVHDGGYWEIIDVSFETVEGERVGFYREGIQEIQIAREITDTDSEFYSGDGSNYEKLRYEFASEDDKALAMEGNDLTLDATRWVYEVTSSIRGGSENTLYAREFNEDSGNISVFGPGFEWLYDELGDPTDAFFDDEPAINAIVPDIFKHDGEVIYLQEGTSLNDEGQFLRTMIFYQMEFDELGDPISATELGRGEMSFGDTAPSQDAPYVLVEFTQNGVDVGYAERTFVDYEGEPAMLLYKNIFYADPHNNGGTILEETYVYADFDGNVVSREGSFVVKDNTGEIIQDIQIFNDRTVTNGETNFAPTLSDDNNDYAVYLDDAETHLITGKLTVSDPDTGVEDLEFEILAEDVDYESDPEFVVIEGEFGELFIDPETFDYEYEFQFNSNAEYAKDSADIFAFAVSDGINDVFASIQFDIVGGDRKPWIDLKSDFRDEKGIGTVTEGSDNTTLSFSYRGGDMDGDQPLRFALATEHRYLQLRDNPDLKSDLDGNVPDGFYEAGNWGHERIWFDAEEIDFSNGGAATFDTDFGSLTIYEPKYYFEPWGEAKYEGKIEYHLNSDDWMLNFEHAHDAYDNFELFVTSDENVALPTSKEIESHEFDDLWDVNGDSIYIIGTAEPNSTPKDIFIREGSIGNSNDQGRNAWVKEGETLVGYIYVNDPDDSHYDPKNFTFKISGPDADKVSLDNVTGALTILPGFSDYEQYQYLDFNITATDAGGLSSTEAHTINIGDQYPRIVEAGAINDSFNGKFDTILKESVLSKQSISKDIKFRDYDDSSQLEISTNSPAWSGNPYSMGSEVETKYGKVSITQKTGEEGVYTVTYSLDQTAAALNELDTGDAGSDHFYLILRSSEMQDTNVGFAVSILGEDENYNFSVDVNSDQVLDDPTVQAEYLEHDNYGDVVYSGQIEITSDNPNFTQLRVQHVLKPEDEFGYRDSNWLDNAGFSNGTVVGDIVEWNPINGGNTELRLFENLSSGEISYELRTSGNLSLDEGERHLDTFELQVAALSDGNWIEGVGSIDLSAATLGQNEHFKVDLSSSSEITISGDGWSQDVNLSLYKPDVAPTISDTKQYVSISEDTVLTAEAFDFSDAWIGDKLSFVQMKSLPSSAEGILLYNSVPLKIGEKVSVSALEAGQLVFSPTVGLNEIDDPTSVFDYVVYDQSGKASNEAKLTFELTSMSYPTPSSGYENQPDVIAQFDKIELSDAFVNEVLLDAENKQGDFSISFDIAELPDVDSDWDYGSNPEFTITIFDNNDGNGKFNASLGERFISATFEVDYDILYGPDGAKIGAQLSAPSVIEITFDKGIDDTATYERDPVEIVNEDPDFLTLNQGPNNVGSSLNIKLSSLLQQVHEFAGNDIISGAGNYFVEIEESYYGYHGLYVKDAKTGYTIDKVIGEIEITEDLMPISDLKLETNDGTGPHVQVLETTRDTDGALIFKDANIDAKYFESLGEPGSIAPSLQFNLNDVIDTDTPLRQTVEVTLFEDTDSDGQLDATEQYIKAMFDVEREGDGVQETLTLLPAYKNANGVWENLIEIEVGKDGTSSSAEIFNSESDQFVMSDGNNATPGTVDLKLLSIIEQANNLDEALVGGMTEAGDELYIQVTLHDVGNEDEILEGNINIV